MIRISKNVNKVVSITRQLKVDYDNDFIIDVTSFIIIPGVTIYNSIYQVDNNLIFSEQSGGLLVVVFATESDLDRFFVQLMRDIKINQIVNVDTK